MGSQIGAKEFLSLDRFPGLTQESVALQTQQGQDGTGVWFTGFRGVPFQCRSIQFFETLADAHTEARDYPTLVGVAPVAITHGGIAIPNHLFQVLKVDSVSVRACVGFVNVDPPDDPLRLGQVTANWTLLPIHDP